MLLKRGPRDRGASLVEFALVAPMLILLLLGIIEFGFFLGEWNELKHGAHEGARLAAVDDSSLLTNTCDTINLNDNSSVAVTFTRSGDAIGDTGTVVSDSKRLVALRARAHRDLPSGDHRHRRRVQNRTATQLGKRSQYHMLMPNLKKSDRGATALLVALAMVVLMGIAAIAVDAGLGWNERRQDQTAADTAVMAGALDFAFGEQAIAEGVLEYVWRNLPSATGASWETDVAYRDTFRACTDPEAATLGLSLSPVTEPNNSGSGGVWDGSTTLPCISVSPLGYTRVRVPDQIVATTFGRAIGVDSLQTNAAAVALIAGRGRLGVLPFGLGSGVSGGDQICLSSAPTGLAEDPCVGAAAGNFGTLKLPIWGNPDVGTTQNCNSAPLNGALAINIAVGADHVIFLAPDISDAVEVRDDAAACAARTFGVNALDTDTGFPSGTESGLVGPLPGAAPASAVPRLLNSSDTISLFGRNIDDKPLWEYLSVLRRRMFPLVPYRWTNGPRGLRPPDVQQRQWVRPCGMATSDSRRLERRCDRRHPRELGAHESLPQHL